MQRDHGVGREPARQPQDARAVAIVDATCNRGQCITVVPLDVVAARRRGTSWRRCGRELHTIEWRLPLLEIPNPRDIVPVSTQGFDDQQREVPRVFGF